VGAGGGQVEAIAGAGRSASLAADKLHAALRHEAAARAEGDASVAATCTLLQQLCAELKADAGQAGLRLNTETGAVSTQLLSLQARVDGTLGQQRTDLAGLRTRLEQHAHEVGAPAAGCTGTLSVAPLSVRVGCVCWG
jgi:hypothetical protein